MKTVAWVHDHRFYVDVHGQHYSSSGVNQATIARYLRYFQRVITVGRHGNLDAALAQMSPIQDDRIEFQLVPDYSGPLQLAARNKEIQADLQSTIANVDCCFILLPSALGLQAARQCKKQGKPYVIQVIGCAWDALWHHGKTVAKIMAPFSFLATRAAVRKAPYVTYITESFLQSRYPARGIVGHAIPNVMIPEPDESILWTRLSKLNAPLQGRQKQIGLIGSLDVDYKGHAQAIKALAEISTEKFRPKLRLLGAGDPERWRSMAARFGTSDQVYFDGTLPSDAVPGWLDDLDLYIQPSSAEGHGRSVVEAMSRACPTIGSSVGGISDSLRPEFRFPARDASALASLMWGILTNRDLAIECARICFSDATRFTSTAVESRRDAFFRTLFQNEFGEWQSNE